jgi:hypothetical protein
MELPLTPLEFARRTRKLYPEREAVVDGDLRLNYEQLFSRCDRWSAADAVTQDLGFEKIGALDPGERSAGDVSYVTHLIPGLDGLGATGGGAHARGEYADLDTLPRQIKRAAVLIYRLTR